MVKAGGAIVGCVEVSAVGPNEAMEKAEAQYPKFAAYFAETIFSFDYSCVGGMMAANN